MKIGIVSTIRNEADCIAEFLDSIFRQTLTPHEVVISDGGSKDGTCDIIRKYISAGYPVKLIEMPSANRSKGRNRAISQCDCDVLAVTDAGCRLDERWLESITRPFGSHSQATAVAGFYQPEPANGLESCVGAMTIPALDSVNPDTFLPSSRSVAFTKEAWKDAGGYPEHLNHNEDTPFDLRLLAAGHKFVFAPDAIVYWRPRSGPSQVYRQFTAYARGDGQAAIFAKTYAGIYVRYCLLAATLATALLVPNVYLPLVLGLLTLISWTHRLRRDIAKVVRRGVELDGLVWVVPVRLAIDFGDMVGYARGTWERMTGKVEGGI